MLLHAKTRTGKKTTTDHHLPVLHLPAVRRVQQLPPVPCAQLLEQLQALLVH